MQPTAILVTMQDNQPMQKFKWRAGDALTNAEFSRFIADFEAGALKAFRKSEAEPCECVRACSLHAP